MVEPTVIKCIRCHIYKPRINFVKDGPLKKLLKLYQLYRLKARFPYILLLLLLTFLELYIYFKKAEGSYRARFYYKELFYKALANYLT